MIPLTLNLATRPWYNRRLFNAVLAATVLFLLLLITGGGVKVMNNSRELQRLKNETRSLDEQLTRKRSGLSQKELVQQKQKLAGINAILERRSKQRWVQVLDDLEELVPAGIALTRLEPDSKGQGLILNGRCKGFADLQRLIENLPKSGRFMEPALVSHSTLQTPGQASQLQFVVSVRLVSQ